MEFELDCFTCAVKELTSPDLSYTSEIENILQFRKGFLLIHEKSAAFESFNTNTQIFKGMILNWGAEVSFQGIDTEDVTDLITPIHELKALCQFFDNLYTSVIGPFPQKRYSTDHIIKTVL